MISGENIEKYKLRDKIYMPEAYINNEYEYILNNDLITIITNNNCYTQYNSTYCDCMQYNIRYNIVSETYQCNKNSSNNRIAISKLTNDINYSERIRNDYVSDYIILFGMLIMAILLTQLFKKNSRRI